MLTARHVWLRNAALRLFCLTAVVLAAGAAVHLGAAPPDAGQTSAAVGGRRWAFLAAVEDYFELAPLPGACRDIAALRERLLSGGFSEENTVLLCDRAKEPRYKPYGANIVRELERLLAGAGPNDLVLVGLSARVVRRGGGAQLCPIETPAKELASPASGTSSAGAASIPISSLVRTLAACQAAQKVLLLDFADDDWRPAGPKGAAPVECRIDPAALFPELPGRIAALAGRRGGSNPSGDGASHSPFMQRLLTGLDISAGGDRRSITLRQLQQAVRQGLHPSEDAGLPRLYGDWADVEILRPAPEDQTGKALAGAAVREGRRLQEAGKLAEAVAAYSKAIAAQPRDENAYRLRAGVYRLLGQYEKALQDCQRGKIPLTLIVTVDEAPLKGKEGQVGVARRGQEVEVTEVQENRLWAESVDGNAAIHGWMHRDHFQIMRRSDDSLHKNRP